MRYLSELLVLAAFVSVCLLVYAQSKIMRQRSNYERRMDSLNQWVTTISQDIDSIQASEHITVTNIKKIHHVYDSTANVIYWLSDSSQNELLFSNLERYKYLLDSAASKDN